ncbi:MAG: molybdopterin molybdotransferase MoeA, partial [Flavobacteriales bacterium]|nr:molybdopterin molybdotransferase MoeA [Flavobacteriales bacterium]
GEVALPAGSMLNAAAIGLLASVGVAQVAVAKRPRVALLISGDEFADGGTPGPGKIFGSNAMMLEAALGEAAIAARAVHVGDDHQALVSAWNALQRDHDVIISTGGVSVGDHDLIPPSLAAIGADIRFHGVMQKPGKPMLFGLLGGTAVFGLPGNPRAVMVLFLEYVLPFLRARQGCAAPWMRSDLLPIAGNVEVKGSRAEFRAARVFKGCVQLLADEGSHMLRTLAVANAIAFLPMDQRQWHHGDHVEVHYLD